MRSSLVRASDSQCQSRNRNILRHSGILGVKQSWRKYKNSKKILLFKNILLVWLSMFSYFWLTTRKSVETNPAQSFIGRIGFTQFSQQLTWTCLYLRHRMEAAMLAVVADKGRVIFLDKYKKGSWDRVSFNILTTGTPFLWVSYAVLRTCLYLAWMLPFYVSPPSLSPEAILLNMLLLLLCVHNAALTG